MPASELAAARAETAKLQRVLGKKSLENEILEEAVEYAAEKKVGCALALLARGWSMTAVCQARGLVRSNVHALRSRLAPWVDGRTQPTPRGDAQFLANIREQITELHRHGYRRACALVNRKRASSDAPLCEPQARVQSDGCQSRRP